MIMGAEEEARNPTTSVTRVRVVMAMEILCVGTPWTTEVVP